MSAIDAGTVAPESYLTFLDRKAISDPATGVSDVPALPDALFPFQRDTVSWLLRRGRGALFAVSASNEIKHREDAR